MASHSLGNPCDVSTEAHLASHRSFNAVAKFVHFFWHCLQRRIHRLRDHLGNLSDRRAYFSVALEMEHLECSDHHAGFSSCKMRQFPEQLNELKQVSSLIHRWEQRFDELSGSSPSPQIMKENFTSMHQDLLVRFVAISKMSSDPAVRGFVFGSSSHLRVIDTNAFSKSFDDFYFCDSHNNCVHLKALSDHLFLCESRLA